MRGGGGGCVGACGSVRGLFACACVSLSLCLLVETDKIVDSKNA